MIALGSDHGGYLLKVKLKKHLDERKIEYVDVGCDDEQSCNYADYAEIVAKGVSAGKYEKGILICGTGIGMCIAANKVKGVRAALVHDVFSAKATRAHNDSNVLTMGERVIGEGLMCEIVDAWLDTAFSLEERHVKRIAKITEIENDNRS